MRRCLTSAAALALAALASPADAQPGGTYPSARTGGNYMHNYYLPPAPSTTPWMPAWAPDGKSVAVSMAGSIWRVDLASGAATELTAARTYHSSPAWSPDGRWIVYTADDRGRTIGLEALNVATGETHPLTADSAVHADPAFSPAGDMLAYVSTRPNGYFNVVVRPIRDGRWAGDPIAVTTDNSFGRSRLYFGEWDVHITPAWMPDGKELLLVSNRGVALGSGNVVRVPVRANAMAGATPVLVEQTLYRARPDVSIDGKRFVYSSTRGAADQYNNLYVQPTAGGEPYKLTLFSHDAFNPRWSPDGEWIAYNSNAGGLPQLALLETYGGAHRTVTITKRTWKRPMGTLAVRVVDPAGRPTAARVHLTAADGKFYAPHDAYARVSGVGDRLFHTTGAFAVDVPAGPVSLLAVKGFEHWPDSARADVRAGDTTRVTVRLRRMEAMAARGWHNGSTHVHTNYAGNLHNTLENVLFMSAAEDQDVVLDLVANKDNRVLDHQFFRPGGGAHPLSTPERALLVGEEYRPPFWGHVFMLGLRDHLISPFTTGYEGTAIESLYPSNTDMLRKARAQGAYTGYVHPFNGDRDPLAGSLGEAKGFLMDAALGTTDAIEWSAPNRATFFPWYAALNAGLRVTATGGEDAISSMHASKLVGSVRTYAHTGAARPDARQFVDALRRGRAFVTTGPLVELTVNGRLAGDSVALPAGGGQVTVAARVRSVVPVDTAFLVFNGEVVERIPLAGDRRRLDVTRTVAVTRSGWYHLRVEGNRRDRFPLDAGYPQAFTNPVWVTVGGRPVRDRAAAEYGLRWLDALRTQADRWPGWRSERERARVFAQIEEARAVYRRLREEGGG